MRGRFVEFILGFAALALAACGGHEEPEIAAPLDPGRLTIDAPAEVRVGSPLALRFRAEERISGPLFVTLDGSTGFIPYTLEMESGEAELELTGGETRYAGVLTVGAQMGNVMTRTQVSLAPGAPVDPVQLLVGPSSIVADGEHWAMAIAIPLDARGNPVADGTPVTIHMRHPLSDTAALSGATDAPPAEFIRTQTRHMLASARVFSRFRAGDLLLAASSGEAFSQERSIREVPGPPVNITLSAGPDGLAADGRQLATVETGPITDAYGNAMLDGMLVEFLVTDSEGRKQRLPTLTIDGQARAIFPAPNQPGTLTIRALVAGVLSAPARLTFVAGPAVNTFDVQAVFDGGEIALIAGPLVGALSQFIPDGTPVAFRITGGQTAPQELFAVADRGYATASLRIAGMEPGIYDAVATVGTGQGQASFRVRENVQESD